MSRSRHHCRREFPVAPIAGAGCGPVAGFGGGCGMGGYGGSYNVFSLIILILVVLTFGKGHRREFGPCEGEHEGILGGTVDNSILFIVAIYFLFSCACCRGGSLAQCY